MVLLLGPSHGLKKQSLAAGRSPTGNVTARGALWFELDSRLFGQHI